MRSLLSAAVQAAAFISPWKFYRTKWAVSISWMFQKSATTNWERKLICYPQSKIYYINKVLEQISMQKFSHFSISRHEFMYCIKKFNTFLKTWVEKTKQYLWVANSSAQHEWDLFLSTLNPLFEAAQHTLHGKVRKFCKDLSSNQWWTNLWSLYFDRICQKSEVRAVTHMEFCVIRRIPIGLKLSLMAKCSLTVDICLLWPSWWYKTAFDQWPSI